MKELEVIMLGSGSKGNSTVIKYGESSIMIDAGFTKKELTNRMELAQIDKKNISAIYLTHAHGDHVNGIGAFDKTPKFASSAAIKELNNKSCYGINDLGTHDNKIFNVDSFPVSHDSNGTVGYVINVGEYKIGYATDLGVINQELISKFKGCNILIIESNYDEKMLEESNRTDYLKNRISGKKGHLSNDDILGSLPDLLSSNTQNLVLAHLSESCNNYKLANRIFKERLLELGRDDICLQVAEQNKIFTIGGDDIAKY